MPRVIESKMAPVGSAAEAELAEVGVEEEDGLEAGAAGAAGAGGRAAADVEAADAEVGGRQQDLAEAVWVG